MGGSGRAGGITRVSENGDQCADRQAEQGTATDAGAVGDDVAEFDGAAGGEMLTAFEENSQYEHRESCDNASAPIPEADHRQRRQDQVSTEMLQLVPDLEAADGDHHRRRGGQQCPRQVLDWRDRAGEKAEQLFDSIRRAAACCWQPSVLCSRLSYPLNPARGILGSFLLCQFRLQTTLNTPSWPFV